jgi:hypothetical protein
MDLKGKIAKGNENQRFGYKFRNAPGIRVK